MEPIDEFLQLFRSPEVRAARLAFLGLNEKFLDERQPKLPERNIRMFEIAQGIEFPPSYRKLLRSCGFDEASQIICDLVWIGQRETPELDLLEILSHGVVPDFLLPVMTYGGNGDHACLDLRSRDARGEYPVVLFDHEQHGCDDPRDTDYEVLAPDFGSFLLGILKPYVPA